MTASQLSRDLRSFLPGIVASEVLAAYAEIKIARTGLTRANAARLSRLGRDYGFHVIVGEDEGFPRRDKAKGGWCNGSREGEVRGPSYFNVYVARSPHVAQQARDAEAAGDDDAFAHLLGTPACCRRFYDLVKDDAAREQNDFFPFSAPASPALAVSGFLNLGAQYFDAALISHFPCSLNCRHSIALARRRGRLLREHDPAWCRQTLYLLNHATLYTEYLGIYLLGGAKQKDGQRLNFDRQRIRGTSRSRIFRALARGTWVGLTPDGALTIGARDRQWSFHPTNPRLFRPAPVSLDDL